MPPTTNHASGLTGRVTAGSTLYLDTIFIVHHAETDSGLTVGFAGDGTLAGSDQIDLRNVNYDSIHSSFDNSTGTLAVSDGSTTASVQFLGHYSQDNFRFADDSGGGTIVYGASAAGQAIANQI